jgi:hypothetical protein
MNMKKHSSFKHNANAPMIARAFYVHRPRTCLIARASVNQGVAISDCITRKDAHLLLFITAVPIIKLFVMKPNESAKEHPVSFEGNQIRGNT